MYYNETLFPYDQLCKYLFQCQTVDPRIPQPIDGGVHTVEERIPTSH